MLLGRAVSPGEPLWLPDDLDAAVAYEEWLLEDHAARCSRCGTRRDDWIGPEGRRYRDPPYVARVVECPGCETLADAEPDPKDPARRSKHVELVPFNPEDLPAG